MVIKLMTNLMVMPENWHMNQCQFSDAVIDYTVLTFSQPNVALNALQSQSADHSRCSCFSIGQMCIRYLSCFDVCDLNLIEYDLQDCPTTFCANKDYKPSRDGRRCVACDLEPVPIDTLYVKTSLFTASQFTFESFIKCRFLPNDDFYQKFLLCVSSQGQDLYSHQKLNMYIYWFSSESGYRRRRQRRRQRRTPQYNHQGDISPTRAGGKATCCLT